MPLIHRLVLAAALATGLPAAASAACSVEVEPVAFGVVDLTRQSSGRGEVVVRCDAETAFAVGISPGDTSGETRRMAGPDGGRLDYYLFTDAGYSTPWGDGQAIGNARPGNSDGSTPSRLTIYGIVPPQSGVPVGEYTDSLQVTLTF
jgi:spore coat protein U-like protein